MRPKIPIFLMIIILSSCAQSPHGKDALSGEKAMEHVKAQVALGPRPPGSPELQKCRDYIAAQLRSYGYKIDEDAFLADTPYGPKQMHNLIARKGEGAKRIIALASHYDSKLMEGKVFVGANDGGSSTGLLLELARVLADAKDSMDYWFVFLDGEEAFVEWSSFDSTYGSRHLAQKWLNEGMSKKIHALILLDMIGDKDLGLWHETNSTPKLMNLARDTAKKIGLGSIFSTMRAPVSDDHVPFIDVGIPSVDLIDLTYGPNNSFHHTTEDTLDKISPQSMEKVGKLVLAMLPELQK